MILFHHRAMGNRPRRSRPQLAERSITRKRRKTRTIWNLAAGAGLAPAYAPSKGAVLRIRRPGKKMIIAG